MKEFYCLVLELVCRISEVGEADVLHSHREDATDARSLLVYLLSERISDVNISRLSGIPRTTVNGLKNNFYERRKKWLVRRWLQRVQDALPKD